MLNYVSPDTSGQQRGHRYVNDPATTTAPSHTRLEWHVPNGFIRPCLGIGGSHLPRTGVNAADFLAVEYGGERRFRAVPERHDMVRVGRAASGAEEWSCPTCGHRMLLRWPPPRFEVTVLAQGDASAAHAGTRSGPEGVPDEVGGMSDDELRWLRNHGIDWNGLAS